MGGAIDREPPPGQAKETINLLIGCSAVYFGVLSCTGEFLVQKSAIPTPHKPKGLTGRRHLALWTRKRHHFDSFLWPLSTTQNCLPLFATQTAKPPIQSSCDLGVSTNARWNGIMHSQGVRNKFAISRAGRVMPVAFALPAKSSVMMNGKSFVLQIDYPIHRPFPRTAAA